MVTAFEQAHLQEFTDAYIEALLWSECDENGSPLDDVHDASDLAHSALADIKADCQQMLSEQCLIDAINTAPGYGASQSGHDFALTRNGHGAGYWDRGLGELGEQLTQAAKSYGSQHLYVGEDGLIYTHG